jgi:hypothetical protein
MLKIVHVTQGIRIHVELLGCGFLKSEVETANRYPPQASPISADI